MRYLRLTSLSWWAGVAAIGLGIAQLWLPHPSLSEGSRVLAVMMGGADASPAGLVLLGLGLIGLRDKMERM